MINLSTFRSPATWRDLGIVALVCGGIILASMALVSFRNRHRAARSTVVEWAFDALQQVPRDTVAAVYSHADFADTFERFRQRIRTGEVPVDSVRGFYHVYARCARDGSLAPKDIAELGSYLGLTARVPADRPASRPLPVTADTVGQPLEN